MLHSIDLPREQFKHLQTLAEAKGQTLPEFVVQEIMKGLPRGRDYVVIFTKVETGWVASAPDIPGCTTGGNTMEDALKLFQQAARLHIAAMKDRGEPIPEPVTQFGTVTVND